MFLVLSVSFVIILATCKKDSNNDNNTQQGPSAKMVGTWNLHEVVKTWDDATVLQTNNFTAHFTQRDASSFNVIISGRVNKDTCLMST